MISALREALDGSFLEVVRELENARFQEVPTYAPKAFDKALAYYRCAQQLAADCGSPDEVNEKLEQALEALTRAQTAAKASARILSTVVEKRAAINKNDQVRFRSPERVNEAEEAYREAIALGDEGDYEGARTGAARALSLYRDAELDALESGLVRNLGNRLQEREAWLSPEARDSALAIVSSLERDLHRAKAGDLDLSGLTDRIALATKRADSVARLDTGFGLGDNSLTMPDRVFDPAPPGWAPGTFGPPTAPLTMRITDRTADSLTVTWRNIISNADANQVVRREGTDGPWEVVAELGVSGEWQSHTDSGLEPDQLYCYRIRVRNSFGSDTTIPDDQACGHTRDGNELTLSRVQLRLRVADIADGGSSDALSVRLNSPLPTYSPSSNNTWLDYGPDYRFSGGSLVISDDFDRGRDFTYDLNLASLNELSDITMISFRKEGSNALALAELALIVNGVVVFDRFFGETSSTAAWIDEYYTIYHPELRAHASWPTSFPLPSLQIPNQELVERMEGMIGDLIHGTPSYWGGRDGSDWVEITHVDSSTLHVRADLKAEIPGPNIEVDIGFDVTADLDCDGDEATLMITTSNFASDVGFHILHDLVTLGIVEFFDDKVEELIDAAWQPIEQSFDIDTGGLCPVVEVDQDGNLNFRLA